LFFLSFCNFCAAYLGVLAPFVKSICFCSVAFSVLRRFARGLLLFCISLDSFFLNLPRDVFKFLSFEWEWKMFPVLLAFSGPPPLPLTCYSLLTIKKFRRKPQFPFTVYSFSPCFPLVSNISFLYHCWFFWSLTRFSPVLLHVLLVAHPPRERVMPCIFISGGNSGSVLPMPFFALLRDHSADIICDEEKGRGKLTGGSVSMVRGTPPRSRAWLISLKLPLFLGGTANGQGVPPPPISPQPHFVPHLFSRGQIFPYCLILGFY